MIELSSSHQLERWLTQQGINIEPWGHGEAKSVSDLWLELLNGETTLHESPTYRQVQVVELMFARGESHLVEAMQELANGERRYRNHLPAEKIKRHENAYTAARRCLSEEFALDDGQIEKIQITIEQTQEKKQVSPSYPGLNTLYVLHRARIESFNFPTGDFATENKAHADGDPVKAHHWRWVKESTQR